MGDRLLEVIKQVGIFMICAQMILHFKPSNSYNKYIKLLISIMVLVQLTLPIMELFGGVGDDGFQSRVLFYDSFISESMEEVNVTSLNAETLLNEMTMEEVKTRINNGEVVIAEETESEEGVEIQIDKIEVSAGE